jgi:hypothetical protein
MIEQSKMSSTYPIPLRWLPPSSDKIDEALFAAYELPDYPGPRSGTGRYVDLFWDAEQTCPIGRLWTNDTDGCGLLHVAEMIGTEYTIDALRLRTMRQQGKTATEALDTIARDRHTGPLFQGQLDDIADLDVEVNVI